MTRRPASGSSPLTRGKLREVQEWREDQGLIPAHAGKTHWLPGPRNLTKAHPRSRGENVAGRDDDVAAGGSSPLTRGKLGGGWGLRGRAGLIPAHAGKTCCSTMWGRNFPAHPRSRGENVRRPRDRVTSVGSSPLTRGKLVRSPRPLFRGRLIPAHAGKTGLIRSRTVVPRAHPRSRGENMGEIVGVRVRGGSSPLTRGKPCRRRRYDA